MHQQGSSVQLQAGSEEYTEIYYKGTSGQLQAASGQYKGINSGALVASYKLALISIMGVGGIFLF